MKSGRRKRKWLSQVAVCVLLSVHSLQVLLLYENVDAFLEKKKDNTLVKVLLSLSHTLVDFNQRFRLRSSQLR